MSNFDFTTLLEALYPESVFGGIDETGDLHKLLQGLADGYQDLQDDVDLLAHIRDPRRSGLLAELEREYGVITDTALTEAVRRQMLAHVVYARPTTASWEHLQNALIDAGFTNLLVTPNNPMVDPSIPGGTLLVNGPIYTSQSPAYYECMGSDIAIMGHSRAVMGYYLRDDRTEKTYTLPTTPYWPWAYVFWVGGAKSNWSTPAPAVALASVDSQRRTQLENLILKYKPCHTWCLMRITWT